MSARDENQARPLPPNFRLRPSRNQKQRSKLSQAPEESAPPSEPAAPVAPVGKTPETSSFKKMRLKRSGQMHQDLTGPMPEEPPGKKQTEY